VRVEVLGRAEQASLSRFLVTRNVRLGGLFLSALSGNGTTIATEVLTGIFEFPVPDREAR
jgi:hypothetical protein